MPLPKRWRYALAGAALGVGDTLLLLIVGAEMRLNTTDILFPTMGLFTATFGGFGYAMGRLAEARAQLAADAVLIRDQVTELRDAQRRVVQAESLAKLGRMAASVAHEVRNPLGVIRSSAALIGESLSPESEDAEAAGFIVEEVDRLDGYVRRILDYARPLHPERHPLQLAEVARRAGRLAEEHLKGAALHIDGDAPELEGDEELLTRLTLGLLINAAQAGAREVTVRLAGSSEAATLTVCDDGEGVSEEARAQLFEPFFTTKARGTGLGLALARRVAEAHGGSLTLVEDEGTCLQLRLPLESP